MDESLSKQRLNRCLTVEFVLLRSTAATALELTGETASVAVGIGHGHRDSLYCGARTSDDRNTLAKATRQRRRTPLVGVRARAPLDVGMTFVSVSP